YRVAGTIHCIFKATIGNEVLLCRHAHTKQTQADIDKDLKQLIRSLFFSKYLFWHKQLLS
ncbi:MAG: hypothetical protein O9353_11145, partial [Bacteroidia bacterium]|nr:hypothetical protein [Bacteroidia bacterium]